jgi:hypothetical protein
MDNESLTNKEDQPNKWYSFIVGIFIAIAIIILFAVLFH